MCTPRFGVVSLLTLGSLLAGCEAARTTVKPGEEPGSRELATIAPSITTRRELLDAFGPPLAILQAGEEAVVPGLDGEETLRYEELFPLFADATPMAGESIYCYQWVELSGKSGWWAALTGAAHDERARLWALVDEDTGLVSGCVYREDRPSCERKPRKREPK